MGQSSCRDRLTNLGSVNISRGRQTAPSKSRSELDCAQDEQAKSGSCRDPSDDRQSTISDCGYDHDAREYGHDYANDREHVHGWPELELGRSPTPD